MQWYFSRGRRHFCRNTHHSLSNHSAHWPPSRPASCVEIVLLWPDFEWEESGGWQSWAEQEEARVEGAEKELARSGGEMASEMTPFRSWSGFWDTHSTLSLRSCKKIRGTQKADFISLEGHVQCVQLLIFLIRLRFIFILYKINFILLWIVENKKCLF